MPAADIYHFGPASERAVVVVVGSRVVSADGQATTSVFVPRSRLVAVAFGRGRVWTLVAVASRRGRVLSRSRLVGSDKSDRPTDGAAAKERRALRRKGSFTARELKCESKHTRFPAELFTAHKPKLNGRLDSAGRELQSEQQPC